MKTTMKSVVSIGVLVVLGGFLLIQVVPYGRDHTNPPVQNEPNWDNQQTRALAERACFDCHSNETKWPWYSNVAPVSWVLQNHIAEGRQVLNFSQWGRGGEGEETGEMAEVIREGEMPPWDYVLMHPEASLTGAEKQQLVDGLMATGGRAAAGATASTGR